MGALAGVAASSSLASTGLGLVSSIMQGEGTQAADQYQAGILTEKAQIGQTQATEVNANSVMRLNQSLGNIDAVRAASGDNPTSPTAVALRGVTTANANQNRAIQVGNILTQSEMDTAGANYLRSAGSFAMTQGIIGGLAGAAKGLAGTNFGAFGLGGTTMGNAGNPAQIGALY
jgi:hypothetical protein